MKRMVAERFEVTNFTKDVLVASAQVPVLVDFWAEWCEPCKFIGPILDKLASEEGVKWKLVKVNTEINAQLASEWGVRGIPNLKLFYNGEVIDEVAGAMPEADLRVWLDTKMPSPARKLQVQGIKEIESGNIEQGLTLLEQALAEDKSLEQSKIVLARHKLFDDPEKVVDLVGDIAYLEQAKELLLLAEAMTLGEENVKGTASKHALVQALDSLKSKNFESALDQFIKAITIDKTYNDELARRLAIAVFHFLGERHEITKKYRRQFDMALY